MAEIQQVENQSPNNHEIVYNLYINIISSFLYPIFLKI